MLLRVGRSGMWIMAVYGWLVQPLVQASASGILSDDSAHSKSLSEMSEGSSVDSAIGEGIQLASWSDWRVDAPPSDLPIAATVARPISGVVRDDAPSEVLVLSFLVGFGVLSLIIGFGNVPFHWLQRQRSN